MKTIAIIAIVAAASALLFATYSTDSSANDFAFQSFINEHGRNYANEAEYEMRKDIFLTSLRKVEEHNAKGLSWTYGINKFSDWTDEEYQRLLGLRNFRNSNSNSKLPVAQLPRVEFEEDLDWRNYPGFVGKVLDQGHCGSCWAFSAAQTLRGAYFKAFGEVVDFSESQLVDCDVFSHGCNGGLQENGFVHLMRNTFATADEYPYVAEDKTCYEKDVANADRPLLATAFRVDVGDDLLYDALTHMPVSISIRAENDDFRHYQGGVIEGDGCGWEIDHAVLLVGFNKADNAWIVKNSWSDSWGENGYVRIGRTHGDKGICGINQQNSIPIFEDEFEPFNV